MKAHPIGTLVCVTECSGINSGRLAKVISTKNMQYPLDYPFVGGRTPLSMAWQFVEFKDGYITAFPISRLEPASSILDRPDVKVLIFSAK